MPLQRIPDARSDVPRDQIFEKFRVDRPGKIVFIGHHLSMARSQRCLIRSISLYGAELDVSPHVIVPPNFFLEILGIHDDIGSTLIRREAEKLTIGFNMLLDPEFLHHVVRLSFETSH
jgi:hypothetical protein